jgi:hypothetical protein
MCHLVSPQSHRRCRRGAQKLRRSECRQHGYPGRLRACANPVRDSECKRNARKLIFHVHWASRSCCTLRSYFIGQIAHIHAGIVRASALLFESKKNGPVRLFAIPAPGKLKEQRDPAPSYAPAFSTRRRNISPKYGWLMLLISRRTLCSSSPEWTIRPRAPLALAVLDAAGRISGGTNRAES